MKIVPLLFLFLWMNYSSVFSQENNFTNISKYEKRWALCHPFVLRKTINTTKYVIKITSNKNLYLVLDSFSNGGKLDAFRHIFWMACLAKKIGAKKALKLGIAHEKANYQQYVNGSFEDGNLPDYASSKMDSLNNLIGANIGAIWQIGRASCRERV